MTNLEPLLTIEEVAKILRMSPSWIKQQIREGRLKQARLGRIVRVERADLRAFIDEEKRKSAVPVNVTTLSIPANFDTDQAILQVTEKSAD